MPETLIVQETIALSMRRKGSYMSTMKLFSIRDAKAKCYNNPFVKSQIGEAERDFTRLANDDKSPVFEFPTDFDLYLIGEYDQETGKLKSLDTPQHLLKAQDVKRV